MKHKLTIGVSNKAPRSRVVTRLKNAGVKVIIPPNKLLIRNQILEAN